MSLCLSFIIYKIERVTVKTWSTCFLYPPGGLGSSPSTEESSGSCQHPTSSRQRCVALLFCLRAFSNGSITWEELEIQIPWDNPHQPPNSIADCSWWINALASSVPEDNSEAQFHTISQKSPRGYKSQLLTISITSLTTFLVSLFLPLFLFPTSSITSQINYSHPCPATGSAFRGTQTKPGKKMTTLN